MRDLILRTAFVAMVVLSPAVSPAQEYALGALPSNNSINLGLAPDGNYAATTLDASHYLFVDCAVGCGGGGGGGGGTVTQGAKGIGPADTWLTSDTALDALISGGTLATSASQTGSWSVSVSNWPATQAVSAAALPLPAGAATSALQSSIITALGSPLQAGGSVAVTSLPSLPTGSNTIGTMYVEPSGASALSLYRAINAASSTMAASIKASSTVLFMAEFCNSNASTVYARLFNLATAPTVGTSTAGIGGVIVPAASCQTIAPSFGINLTTGLSVDVTTGSLADTDTTAITAAGTVTVTVVYK